MPLPDFDALWNYNDPAATEKQFRDLLPEAEASGDISYLAQLLTQIARTQGLQRQFDAAHQTLDQVRAMLRDDLALANIRYLLERGRVFNSSQQKETACPLFLQAWELAKTAHEDFYAVDAAHMLGIAAPQTEQLDWNLKALEYAENSPQPRAQKWLGSLYNNIGWTYHDAGEYEKALEVFQKALSWHQNQPDNAERSRIARWSIARTLRSLGRVDEALTIQRELLADGEKSARKDGYVYEEMAELLHLKQDAQAAHFFAEAYELLSADIWLSANEPERLGRLKALADKST